MAKTISIKTPHMELVTIIQNHQKGLFKPTDIEVVEVAIIELYKTIVLPTESKEDYPKIVIDSLQ